WMSFPSPAREGQGTWPSCYPECYSYRPHAGVVKCPGRLIARQLNSLGGLAHGPWPSEGETHQNRPRTQGVQSVGELLRSRARACSPVGRRERLRRQVGRRVRGRRRRRAREGLTSRAV